MKSTDEELRRAFREATRPDSREGCLPSDLLARTAQHELTRAERRQVTDHLAGCSACSEELQHLRSLQEDAALPGPPRLSPPPWRRWLFWGTASAAVATIAVVIGLTLNKKPPAPQHPIELRAAPEGELRSRLPDNAKLPRGRVKLAWEAVPGAWYAISVTTGDLRPIARAGGLHRPEYHVSESALARVPAGARIVWTVRAFLPDGRTLSSPAFIVRLE